MLSRVTTPTVSAADARRLLMGLQGLLDDPGRRVTSALLERTLDQLGFVQLDSINVVDRAQHLTLGARLHAYRPRHLETLLEKRRSLFEHWTHDASAIPIAWYPHWKHRFRAFAKSERYQKWKRQRLGPDGERVVRGVRRRLAREGPLMNRHFEAEPGQRGSWWGWTPTKTALEFLWHTGEVAISGRENFHKVYDLAERVHPEAHRTRISGPRQHLDWACREAIRRLGVASPAEIAAYWKAVPPAKVRRWCNDAVRRGELVAVQVEDAAGGTRRPAVALADWQERVRALPPPPAGMRVLGPFDPVIRDRTRLQRRFGFEYSFEAFVPAAKRVHGYYVLPVLEEDRFVARIDPKLHRDEGRLEVRALYWEPELRASRAHRAALEDALGVVAERVGARLIDLPR